MRRLTRCVAASLVLLVAPLAACGTDDDEPERTDASAEEATTTTGAAVRPVDPRAALLTLDDLPPGYAVDDSGSSDEDSPSGGCEELESMDESAADDARTAEVAFTGGEGGPFVFHAVGDQDEGTAAREFDNFRAAIRKPQCRTFQETDEQGRTVTWTVEPISTVRVGDDTVAFRITGRAGAFNITFDFAVERIGDNVSVVGTARAPMIGALPPELSALTRRAHEKLERAAA